MSGSKTANSCTTRKKKKVYLLFVLIVTCCPVDLNALMMKNMYNLLVHSSKAVRLKMTSGSFCILTYPTSTFLQPFLHLANLLIVKTFFIALHKMIE